MATTGDPAADARESTAMLRTEGLVKRFGSFTAIDEVSLTVERGEFRSIIGPNGAGKTTLFNLISGALDATEGAVYFNGEEVTDRPPEKRIQLGMGRSFQISNVLDGLSVRENVRLAVQATRRDSYSLLESLFRPTDRYDEINEAVDQILEQVGLAAVAEETAAALPYGDKRRLEIGAVLATDPELVLFDEPTAGMSPEQTQETVDLIRDVLAEQSLVLVEHDIELVMALSDSVTVLNRGEVIAEGSPEAIANDPEVQDAYIGGAEL